jgi:hypothetical protein
LDVQPKVVAVMHAPVATSQNSFVGHCASDVHPKVGPVVLVVGVGPASFPPHATMSTAVTAPSTFA